MALFNVSTTNNTLLSTSHSANCESEVINQDGADTDFESIRETRVHWRLQNISSPLSTADTLISNTPILENDRIFIRKNDGSLYDTFATGVVTNTAPVHPNMTSNTAPEGVATANYAASTAYRAFDGNDTTNWGQCAAGRYIQYQFKDNTPTQVFQFYIKAGQSSNTGYKYAFNLLGSMDGTNWSTISTHPSTHYYYGKVETVESPGAFSYYRLHCTYAYTTQEFYTFSLLDPTGTQVDTSGVTQGEIPDQVFKFTDTLSFNGSVPASQKDVHYEYGTAGTKLAVTSLYNDYVLSGRVLRTRLDFRSSGNEVVEITGQIFKEV